MESAINVPMAAPIPAGNGPNIVAKKAGMITAGLNCPKPHGDGMYAVAYEPAAYRPAHKAIATVKSDMGSRFSRIRRPPALLSFSGFYSQKFKDFV
jgi:hypothetical protein